MKVERLSYAAMDYPPCQTQDERATIVGDKPL